MDHNLLPTEQARDKGPSLLDFGIIIGAIVVISALALMFFGGQTSVILSTVSGGV